MDRRGVLDGKAGNCGKQEYFEHPRNGGSGGKGVLAETLGGRKTSSPVPETGARLFVAEPGPRAGPSGTCADRGYESAQVFPPDLLEDRVAALLVGHVAAETDVFLPRGLAPAACAGEQECRCSAGQRVFCHGSSPRDFLSAVSGSSLDSKRSAWVGPFSSLSTPRGQTAAHTPQPTHEARTMFSPRCA